MTTKVNMNGQARKSLAEQIDRLDSMLDGLADGLNDAIAAAVKDAVGMAVQQAVQVVMREMLTSPELLARLGAAVPAAPPAPEKAPKTKVSWKQRWLGVGKTLAATLNAGRIWCGRRVQGVRSQASGLLQQARMLGRFRNQLLVAGGIGMTVGVMAYMAGPWLSAAAGGIGGFAASLAVQLGLSLRRLLAAIPAQSGTLRSQPSSLRSSRKDLNMTQSDLNRAVVRRTGESSRRIRRMGFTLLAPAAPIRRPSGVHQGRTGNAKNTALAQLERGDAA